MGYKLVRIYIQHPLGRLTWTVFAGIAILALTVINIGLSLHVPVVTGGQMTQIDKFDGCDLGVKWLISLNNIIVYEKQLVDGC